MKIAIYVDVCATQEIPEKNSKYFDVLYSKLPKSDVYQYTICTTPTILWEKYRVFNRSRSKIAKKDSGINQNNISFKDVGMTRIGKNLKQSERYISERFNKLADYYSDRFSWCIFEQYSQNPDSFQMFSALIKNTNKKDVIKVQTLLETTDNFVDFNAGIKQLGIKFQFPKSYLGRQNIHSALGFQENSQHTKLYEELDDFRKHWKDAGELSTLLSMCNLQHQYDFIYFITIDKKFLREQTELFSSKTGALIESLSRYFDSDTQLESFLRKLSCTAPKLFFGNLEQTIEDIGLLSEQYEALSLERALLQQSIVEIMQQNRT